jgi:hypothetical protein
MGVSEMDQVAEFYSRVLLKEESPQSVAADVQEFKSDFHTVRYCFNPNEISGYPIHDLL